MLKHLTFIFHTELILKFRRNEEWIYPLTFFLIVMSLFPLAITPDPIVLQKFSPGLIWVTALLSTLLSMESIFTADQEENFLEQITLSQISLSLFMIIKFLVHWMTTQLPIILLTPLLAIIFHLDLITTLTLMLSLVLGTPILTAIGLVGAGLTFGLRQQGVLLGLILLPLAIPVLIFGVSIVEYQNAHLPISGALAFLASIMIMTITCLPIVAATCVRLGIEN